MLTRLAMYLLNQQVYGKNACATPAESAGVVAMFAAVFPSIIMEAAKVESIVIVEWKAANISIQRIPKRRFSKCCTSMVGKTTSDSVVVVTVSAGTIITIYRITVSGKNFGQ
jgi:hypothetical protein